MPRISIDDFRARLTGGDTDRLARVYREVTRRPELRRPAAELSGWIPWGVRDTPAATA
jgi:hypothetical protein